MCVDHLVIGDNNLEEAKEIKRTWYNYSKKWVSIYISGTQMGLNWRVKVVTKTN